MKKILNNNIIFVITSSVFSAAIILILLIYMKTGASRPANTADERIASLAPSATEYLYAIGLGDKIIADTIYCNYPEDAKNKAKIGALEQINYEYMARLNINTAVLQQGMDKQKQRLEEMGIRVITISNNTIDDIISSFDTLGAAFDMKETADLKKRELIEKIEAVKNNIPKNEKKETAVISVFRNAAPVTTIIAAGGNNLYNDILDIFNLENPFAKYTPYPEISAEGIISVNPDIIIDITRKDAARTAAEEWNALPFINAVRNGRIYIMEDNMISIPGPRIADILQQFAETLYGRNNAENK